MLRRNEDHWVQKLRVSFSKRKHVLRRGSSKCSGALCPMGFWAVPVAVLAAAHASRVRQPTAPLGPSSPGIDAGGVVIKTWGLLKETTDAMTSRAQEVLSVRMAVYSTQLRAVRR